MVRIGRFEPSRRGLLGLLGALLGAPVAAVGVAPSRPWWFVENDTKERCRVWLSEPPKPNPRGKWVSLTSVRWRHGRPQIIGGWET